MRYVHYIFFSLVWVDVALMAGSALAAAPISGINPVIAAAETRVSLGLSVAGTQYSEGFGSLSDQEGGVLPGFQAGVSRLGDLLGIGGIYTGVVYDFDGGGLAYHGFLQNSSGQYLAPFEANDRARFNTVEVRLGKAVPLSASVDLLPFVAAGYQNWYRNVAGSYSEFYRAALAGIGAKLDVAMGDRLVTSVRIEGLAVVDGRASASALGFSGGFGTSGEEDVHLGADWRMGNILHLFAGLGVRHFNYGGSGLNNGFYEPSSSTLVVRSEVGLAVGF